MAPAKKKTNRGQKNRNIKDEKLASFIKDFDSQVKTVVEELKATVASRLKEVDSLYNIELIKLPAAMREMCWLDYLAKGGSLQVLEKAATVNVDIEQITASVSQTPFKPAKKGRKKRTASESTEENILVQSELKSKTSVKASTAKSRRKSVVSTAAKRTSKRTRATPSYKKLGDSSVLGYTPVATPKIDARVFRTPGLRTPSMQEPVYTFSANGSPLGGMNDLFINLPTGNGKNIRLTAEDMDNAKLNQLDRKALQNIKLLSTRLQKICTSLN
ncbi:borealin [Hyperolius riggenbachi]|uniref:borealin n=1 Tax=Hyperolius riggenbachi TaxID=752182 RepID=UPI0035A3A6EA